MGLHVWSVLQVRVAVPLACWPLGQVTGTVCPTRKSPCEALALISDQPGGGGQDLAVYIDGEIIINACQDRTDVEEHDLSPVAYSCMQKFSCLQLCG